MTSSADTFYVQALAAYHAGDKTACARLAGSALAARLDLAGAHVLRAVSLDQDQLAVAAAHYASACRTGAFDSDAWYNRALFLQRLGSLGPAIDCYRRALHVDPGHIGALTNATDLIRIHEHFEEALRLVRRWQRLQPDCWLPYCHQAISLQALERFDEADEAFARAIMLAPEHAQLHWEHHFSLLARQRFEEAWHAYEFRFACGSSNGVIDMTFDAPRWQGDPRQHVLVYGEQGLGDQIMFASALPDLVATGAQVSLAVTPALVGLFAGSFPDIPVLPIDNGQAPLTCGAVLAQAGHARKVDAVLPMGSLMTLFRKQRGDFDGLPYLRPSAQARQYWSAHPEVAPERRKLLRVGLCWACNPARERFASARRAVHRTIPPELIARLVDRDDIDVIGITNVPLAAFDGASHLEHRLIDVSADLTQMDRTAALVEGLDLLITVDTGVAHLAGALGVPVWILLHKAGDARWGMRGTARSYWYNSARLFWQVESGDWSGLLTLVEEQFDALIKDVSQEACA